MGNPAVWHFKFKDKKSTGKAGELCDRGMKVQCPFWAKYCYMGLEETLCFWWRSGLNAPQRRAMINTSTPLNEADGEHQDDSTLVCGIVCGNMLKITGIGVI